MIKRSLECLEGVHGEAKASSIVPASSELGGGQGNRQGEQTVHLSTVIKLWPTGEIFWRMSHSDSSPRRSRVTRISVPVCSIIPPGSRGIAHAQHRSQDHFRASAKPSRRLDTASQLSLCARSQVCRACRFPFSPDSSSLTLCLFLQVSPWFL